VHVFDEYAATSVAQVTAIVRQNPFALVISSGPPAPVATHVPVVVPGDRVEPGAVLWGHMARANPQWESFSADAPLLVVFSGPHSYISAGHYARTPAVPTWNYSAVHVTARPEIIDDPADTLGVLTETVRACEGVGGTGWDMTDSVPRFEQIMSGVVAFRLHVLSVQAVVKLSQDKPDELWHRVHDALAADPDSGRRQVAADMAAVRADQ
jgi:transcriptional regulator